MFRFIVIASISLAMVGQLKAQPLELHEANLALVPAAAAATSETKSSSAPRTTAKLVQTTSAPSNVTSTATPSGGDTDDDVCFFWSAVSFAIGFVLTGLVIAVMIRRFNSCGFVSVGILGGSRASGYQSISDRKEISLSCCFSNAQSCAMNPYGRTVIYCILGGMIVSITVYFLICPSLI